MILSLTWRCSPGYLFFRMGWLVLQFCTVAETWCVKVGPCVHFFGKMYRKIPKKLRFSILKNSKNENSSPKTHFLELEMHIFDISSFFAKTWLVFHQKKSRNIKKRSFFAENTSYLCKKLIDKKSGRYILSSRKWVFG